MGSVPVKKALSKKVDKRPLRRMQRYMDSVYVKKALSKKVDKRPLRRMQRYMDSLSVNEALSKEVDKGSLRRMQRTWVQYRCIKHYPRKWIKDHYEECDEHGKRKKDTSKSATNMGSVPVKKALSREVDKRPLRRMQRYMGSVSVHEALSKEVDKRSLRRMQRTWVQKRKKDTSKNATNMGSVPVKKALSREVDKRPLRRMQRYMGSVSVHEALSKEVDKRSLRRMQRTWVQYRCIKHYPRKWIKDHYEECNEHGKRKKDTSKSATNMGSVSVHEALSKEVDKRSLRRMQRYMGSVSVHEALSKEVDKRSLRRMQRTWVQYRCIKHYPRKWIKDHYEECNEHGFKSIFEGSEEKTLRGMQRCMGSKSVDKALSMKVDKSLVERMLLGISSVSVQKAFLKEAKKRHFEECNEHGFSTCEESIVQGSR
ncbi:putative feeding circuit activating protein [Trichinella pseudospiralis]